MIESLKRAKALTADGTLRKIPAGYRFAKVTSHRARKQVEQAFGDEVVFVQSIVRRTPAATTHMVVSEEAFARMKMRGVSPARFSSKDSWQLPIRFMRRDARANPRRVDEVQLNLRPPEALAVLKLVQAHRASGVYGSNLRSWEELETKVHRGIRDAIVEDNPIEGVPGGSINACIARMSMRPDVDDPGALCASLARKAGEDPSLIGRRGKSSKAKRPTAKQRAAAKRRSRTLRKITKL